MICPKCKGRGTVTVSTVGDPYNQVRCKQCNGTGVYRTVEEADAELATVNESINNVVEAINNEIPEIKKGEGHSFKSGYSEGLYFALNKLREVGLLKKE